MCSAQRAEAIDTRWVFRVYAALASLAGFLLLGWGPIWFGAQAIVQALKRGLVSLEELE